MITTKTRAAAALDAILATVNNTGGPTAGALKIYNGTPPADLAASITGTLLANCALVDGSHAAFGSTSTSTLVATGYTSGGIFAQDTSADATGTATHFRIFDYTGAAVLQGTVTATGGGGDLTLDNTSIVSGGTVTITSFNPAITTAF